MSVLSSQADRLRLTADAISERGVSSGDLAIIEIRLREAADTIEGLRQKVEDLEDMLGELPHEGKCAMLLVRQVDGEYIWGCELYDFASYCLVDSEADTYTGMMLNDPFGRADFADKLTMAKELRRMAASLDAQGDVLGIMPNDGTRYHELFGTPERAARTLIDCNAFKQCVDCPVCHDEHGETCEIPGDCAFVMRDYYKLLGWLEGDA